MNYIEDKTKSQENLAKKVRNRLTKQYILGKNLRRDYRQIKGLIKTLVKEGDYHNKIRQIDCRKLYTPLQFN